MDQGTEPDLKALISGENNHAEYMGQERMKMEGTTAQGMSGREWRAYKRALRLRRERRRRLFFSALAIIAACLIFWGGVVYSSFRTSANNGFKYYTGVTVEPGETLWNLSDSYIDYDYYKDKNQYISEVQNINHLEEDCSLSAGQLLILPYYSDVYVK